MGHQRVEEEEEEEDAHWRQSLSWFSERQTDKQTDRDRRMDRWSTNTLWLRLDTHTRTQTHTDGSASL